MKMKISRYWVLPFLITICIFFIPFFWLKPGEMDLGGDNSRLYFYDPIAYLTSQSLYSVSHSGLGGENLSYYAIPSFLLLAFVKSLVHSPTILIFVFHGLNMSLGFISCYLVVKELLKREEEKDKESLIIEIASILAGLFYTFSPIPIGWWGYPLLTMNLVFLNPLLFFLLLRFFLTSSMRYLLVVLLVTFIFSPNFSFIGAPTFFAFFPLAFLFLLTYTKYVTKRPIPIAKLAIGLLLFIGLHAFHLFPQIASILTPGTAGNETVFGAQGKFEWGLKYFLGTAPIIKVSNSLLGAPQFGKAPFYAPAYILFPFLFVLGFLWNKSRLYLLTAIFFFITLFLVTANITTIGFKLYVLAFRLPGFSMFRVFYGQWAWVYLFFYTLLIGLALATVLPRLKTMKRYLLIGSIVVLFVTTSWPLISGKLTDTTHWQSKGVKSHVKMDPAYEDVLSYLRTLPVDGKILSFPLNDHGYQVLKGENNAAYVGPSTITYLAARNEFNSVAEFGDFGPSLLTAAREKNYTKLKNIFTMLNIKYIFYNEDPYIYGDNFPALPYSQVRNFFPDTQEGYKELIKNLGVKEIKTIAGKYHIYETSDADYLPHVYVAREKYYVNQKKNDILFPLEVFKVLEKRIALYGQEDTSKVNDSYDGVFLKAQNNNSYIDDVPKAVDFASGEAMQSVDNKIKELQKGNAPWQQVLDEYVVMMTDLIKEGEKLKDYSSIVAYKVKINQVLTIHEVITSRALFSNKTKSFQDKIVLSLLSDKVFDRLREKLNLSIPEPTKLDYTVNSPLDMTYEVYVTKDIVPYYGAEGEIIVDGKNISPHSFQLQENLLQLENVHINQKQNVEISLKDLQYFDLIEKSPWHTFSRAEVNPATVTFALNEIVGNREGLFRQIYFKPNTLYFVSFNYHTNGQNFLAILYEIVNKPGNSPPKIANQLSVNILRSVDWKTMRTVIQTGNDPNSELVMQILPRDDNADYLLYTNTQNTIQIEDFFVVEIPQAQIIFKSLNLSRISEKSSPEISFRKISPTRYEVKVKNAKNPYTLIFLQAFHKNWKLIDQNRFSENINDPIVTGQEISRDVFFDRETLSTLGKAAIAQDRHRMVNGYANSWDIEPKDFNDKTDYTIIIEMADQQLFYISLFISVTAVVFCMVWLSMIVCKNILQNG